MTVNENTAALENWQYRDDTGWWVQPYVYPHVPYTVPYTQTITVTPTWCADDCHVFGCEHADTCKCGKATRTPEPKTCGCCGKAV
jgi:hypothetical protein